MLVGVGGDADLVASPSGYSILIDGDLFGAPATNTPAGVQDSAPAMTSVGINPANFFPGKVLTAVVVAHDDDGDHIT